MTFSSFRTFAISILIVLATSFHAQAQDAAGEPMRLEPHEELLTIMRVGVDEPLATYSIEIADTNENRSRGLMHRTDLPQDRAMLFVFEGQAMRSFWMANTPTSLDIIFADSDGRVTHIARDTTPFSRLPITSNEPAKYALEVHAGQVGDFDITRGDLLVHPVIASGE